MPSSDPTGGTRMRVRVSGWVSLTAFSASLIVLVILSGTASAVTSGTRSDNPTVNGVTQHWTVGYNVQTCSGFSAYQMTNASLRYVRTNSNKVSGVSMVASNQQDNNCSGQPNPLTQWYMSQGQICFATSCGGFG